MIRTVKRLAKMADDVIALESEYAALTDAELKAKTQEFKDRLGNGEEHATSSAHRRHRNYPDEQH